jgi:hypothetical protein
MPSAGADQVVSANLADLDQTIKAVAGSQVAYLLVGLKYDLRVWRELWPRIMNNVIEAIVTPSRCASTSRLPVCIQRKLSIDISGSVMMRSVAFMMTAPSSRRAPVSDTKTARTFGSDTRSTNPCNRSAAISSSR